MGSLSSRSLYFTEGEEMNAHMEKIKLRSHAQEMMKAFVYGNTVGGHEFVGLQRVTSRQTGAQ